MIDSNINFIKLFSIVSIKPKIEPITLKIDNPDSNTYYKFKLHYKTSQYDRFLEEIKGDYYLESSCVIEYECFIDKIPKTTTSNPDLLIELIWRINKIIDSIRYSYSIEHPLIKLHLRNIGIEDFLFYRIDINNQHEITSAKDNFTNKNRKLIGIKSIIEEVPFEWSTIQKALDLLERGLYEESILIAFATLDHCVQKTIKSKLTTLTEKEKEELLRQIKEQRIKTYLGPLLKALTGKSIYDQKLTIAKVETINSLRNDLIHKGKKCSYYESLNSIRIIQLIIKNLNKMCDQDFKIPLTLLFMEE